MKPTVVSRNKFMSKYKTLGKPYIINDETNEKDT